MPGLPAPQIGFNYLGRFAASAAADWGGAGEAVRLGGGDPAMPLGHCIEVNALTLDDREGTRFTATWSWAPALVAEAEVRDLAQCWFAALEALVRHAAAPGAGGRTPCDLPLVSLSQAEIEGLESTYPQIEDVLPLAPLQEGLLFHALYDAQAPDIYTVQLELGLEGALDSDSDGGGGAGAGGASCQPARALPARASRPAGADHRAGRRRCPGAASICRHWMKPDVRSAWPPSWRRSAPSASTSAGAPLIRFALIRLAADRHRLVLTNHHIVMDGWSMPVLVRELLTLYAHRGDAAVLPRVTPYRDYLAWMAGQDRAAARAAWREALAGLEEATRLAPHDPGRAPVAPEQMRLALSATLTTALTAQARRHGLTLNTLIQAAWAILLGRLTGREDVVFGVTVAGRPPEIAGIESMVGLFINTLPLRVQLPPGTALLELLRQVQNDQSRADGAPASGPCRGAGAGGTGRAVRHAGGVRELSGRPRRPFGAKSGVCGSPTSAGSMPPIIRSAWPRTRASGCSCS